MADFNPDKEGHVKKKFIVQRAWPGKPGLDTGDTIHTSKGELKFDKEGRMMINDPALAREVQSQYSQELAVTRVRYPDAADRGHKYFFSAPALPWAKYDEFGRRLPDDPEPGDEQ